MTLPQNVCLCGFSLYVILFLLQQEEKVPGFDYWAGLDYYHFPLNAQDRVVSIAENAPSKPPSCQQYG